MCMEDIRLGRQKIGATRMENVAAGGTFTIPANGKRVGLFISHNHLTASVLVFRGSAANTVSFFAAIPFQVQQLYMDIERFGDLVQNNFTVQNPSGTTFIAYTDVLLDQQ